MKKLYYIAHGSFYAIAFAENERQAFEKMWESRKRLLYMLDLPKEMSEWMIEEFTEEMHDGVLCFY